VPFIAKLAENLENDASNTAQPRQIRTLFAVVLTTRSPTENPEGFWEKYKDYTNENIVRTQRIESLDIQFTPNEILISIGNTCSAIVNKSLTHRGMILYTSFPIVVCDENRASMSTNWVWFFC